MFTNTCIYICLFYTCICCIYVYKSSLYNNYTSRVLNQYNNMYSSIAHRMKNPLRRTSRHTILYNLHNICKWKIPRNIYVCLYMFIVYAVYVCKYIVLFYSNMICCKLSRH